LDFLKNNWVENKIIGSEINIKSDPGEQIFEFLAVENELGAQIGVIR